jgi:hypothetical protein
LRSPGYQIPKNCRTSVKMIGEFYASHIKNMVDASVINVRRSKAPNARTRKRASLNDGRTAAKTLEAHWFLAESA